MIELSTSDREVIRYLFAHDEWADLYEMHVRFGLTPGQLIDIVERLSAADFAEIDGIKARLTPSGRRWVIAAQGVVFRNTDKEVWRPGLDSLLHSPEHPQPPYLPNLKLVDKDFFLRLASIDDDDNATR